MSNVDALLLSLVLCAADGRIASTLAPLSC